MADEVMREVYETRRQISSAFGNNVSACVEGLRSLRESARRLGLSFAEYCLKYRVVSNMPTLTR